MPLLGAPDGMQATYVLQCLVGRETDHALDHRPSRRRSGVPPEDVLASRLCPVCQKVPIHAGQEVCSGRCRAARSRQRKAEARRERDAEIRALLEAALEKLSVDP